MNYRLTISLLTLLILGTISSCKKDEQPIVYPDTISIDYNSLRPEGIEFDESTDRILLGSTLQGEVIALDAEGNYSSFIEDEALNSVTGLHIDATRNRLLVCNSNGTFMAAELGLSLIHI